MSQLRSTILALSILSCAILARPASGEEALPSASAGPRPVAKEEAPPANTLTLNPVRYFVQHYQLEYERVIAPWASVFLSPTVYHHPESYGFGVIPHPPNTTADGIGADFGARFFVTGHAPGGAFVGPFLSAYQTRELRDGDELEGLVLTLGGQAGYTLLLWERLIVSAGGGVGYGFATAHPAHDSPPGSGLPHAGVAINLRFNVGVAF